jgi:hypothetical protein
MLHEAIYSLLSSTEADIYPGVGEQEVNPPFIIHTKVNTTPTPDKDGESKNDFVVYRIATYSNTMAEAQSLSDSIRVVLDDYSGVVEGTDILKIRFANEQNGFDEESGFFFVMQTYQILIRLIT